MECIHLLDNVTKDTVKEEFEDILNTKNFSCSECGTKEQAWVCLQCGVVNCGRYVNGHAKQHAEKCDHQLCMSCDAFSVYCYQCDDYISNDTDDHAINKIRQSVMLAKNHHENARVRLEKMVNEDGTRSCTSNSSTEQNDDQNDDIYDESSNRNFCESPIERLEPCDIMADEVGEKCTKKESPSPRLRSRKRSHSDDTNGADLETPNTTKSKDKKISYNGKREKKVVGLKNLGNTCFMNAVLQSLSNIQEFSYYFSQLPSLEYRTNGRKVYHSRSITRQEVHDALMAEELRKVLTMLNAGGCGKAAISPECLFLVIWKVVPRFRGYQQQDAHEFLRYMLDRLHTELLQLLPPDNGFLPRTPSASIVTAVFGGTLQSEVRCLACGGESKKFDPFLDLSLELPEARADGRPGPISLSDCLASFVQVEELADTERYFCNTCKCKQKSTKQFWIRRLPNVLCLHLKRFRWHNYFRTKVDTCVEFPMRGLDVSRLVPAGAPDTRRSGLGAHHYDLAAVIVHHGSGAGSGHYTAFAANEGQWFHFNDQTVRPADAASVAACKPYILFYIRCELA